LTKVIGRSDLEADPDLATAAGRLARQDQVDAAVEAWTLRNTPQEAMRRLQTAGVSAGVVADARYLLDSDAQLQHRGNWQSVDHAVMGKTRFASPPFLVDGERVKLRAPPLLGEHTDEVLSRVLGFTADRIAQLRADHVLR
jgi:benzylsuccinate CoA-transferase BbsF subunit